MPGGRRVALAESYPLCLQDIFPTSRHNLVVSADDQLRNDDSSCAQLLTRCPQRFIYPKYTRYTFYYHLSINGAFNPGVDFELDSYGQDIFLR